MKDGYPLSRIAAVCLIGNTGKGKRTFLLKIQQECVRIILATSYIGSFSALVRKFPIEPQQLGCSYFVISNLFSVCGYSY